MLKLLDAAEPETDACLFCEATASDEVIRGTCLHAACSIPGDDSKSIEAEVAGTLGFFQLPITPAEGRFLEPIIGQFLAALGIASGKSVPFYIRMYKESRCETVVQLLSPIRTTRE